jgi:RND family efflux transporter MFP subunit
LIIISIGFVLAGNKAKIDKAASPEKEHVRVPVKTIDVREDSFNTAFTINGETSPAKEVKIASEVQGKLIGLYIKNGDMVRAGQVIARLDASVFRIQLNSIEASLAKAELDLARYEKLIGLGGATPMQLESVALQYNSLLAQRKEVLQQMDHMQIRAPFAGKIENVGVELGSFVSYGTILSELINNSDLKIQAYLSEQEAIQVKTGQEVNIRSVVSTQAKKGLVTMVSDKADASGKFMTEIRFTNVGKEQLKAGMLVDVSFSLASVKTGLSIPVSSILGSARQAKVFLVNGNTVRLREIKTGIITSDKAEVIEGLQPGDQVVVSGQLNLENGSVITIIK